MPTPFTHLWFAQDMVALAGLSGLAYDALSAEKPAFLLGGVAPGAQTVSGQPREATHFFHVPFHDTVPACRHLFAAYLMLAQPGELSRPQAAFLSGYVTHLALDGLWNRVVFEPFFGSRAK